MKKLFGYFLVSVMVCLSSAKTIYLFYLDSAQFRCRSASQIAMKGNENLAVLKISTAQYKVALTDDHEVKINGLLFDVDHVVSSGDSLTLYVLRDLHEEELLNSITSLIETRDVVITTDESSHFAKIPLVSLNDWRTLPAQDMWQIETIAYSIYSQIFYRSTETFNSELQSIPSPPPRILS